MKKLLLTIVSVLLLLFITACNSDAEQTAQDAACRHTEITVEAVAPNCTDTGLTEGKSCSKCGEILTAQQEIAALGHTEVTDPAIAPDCTNTGLTEGKHCSVCNGIFTAQQEIAALGHTEVTDPAISPDCTNTGLTEGKHCSVCNEVFTAQQEIAALGHTEVVIKATAPSCTEQGLTEGKYCDDCGEILTEQQPLDEVGHKDEGLDYVCDTCGTDLPKPDVEITLITGKNENPTPYTVAYDALENMQLPEPEKVGHTFLGWYADEELSTAFEPQSVLPGTTEITLYAGYSVNSYIVTVHSLDTTSGFTVKYGEEIPLDIPTEQTHFFRGFFEDKNFTRPLTYDTMPAKNISVYVNLIESFTVNFYAPDDRILTVSGGELTQILTPSNTQTVPISVSASFGYTFLGYSRSDIPSKIFPVENGEIVLSASDLSQDVDVSLEFNYGAGDIPAVIIDTNDVPIKDKVNYVDMTFKIVGSDADISGVTGGVRYRGNSTYTFPKKPYRIKFDEKQSLFGLTKAKSWVLLADYIDPSGLRNFAAFSLADDANFKFVPSPHKVNLFLNGEYMGIFTLCEQVQENKGRIGIEEDVTADMTELKDFNFFIAMDGKVLEDPEAVEGETYFYLEEYGKYIELKYPEKDQFVSEEQFESFFSQLEEYMTYIFGIFTEGDVERILSEVNIETLVDYLIIDQIMGEKDHHSHSFNMFFTSTSGDESIDGKLNFGPIWDYDFSLHTPWTREPNEHYEMSDKISYSNCFFQAVASSPELYAMVVERYNTYFYDRILEVANDIEVYSKEIIGSVRLNQELWYSDYDSEISQKNIDFLIDFLKHRRELLKEKWVINS